MISYTGECVNVQKIGRIFRFAEQLKAQAKKHAGIFRRLPNVADWIRETSFTSTNTIE